MKEPPVEDSQGDPEAAESDDAEDPGNWLSLDYVHDQVQSQLEAQSELWDVVDGRLRLILGVIGIVFAASATFQRGASQAGAALIPFGIGLAVIVAVALFLAAATIVAFAYWPQKFNRPPDPLDLRSRWLTTDPSEVKLIVVDSMLDAYNDNEAVIEAKNRAFKRAFVVTAVAIALMGLALVGQVNCQMMPSPWPWWPFGRSGC